MPDTRLRIGVLVCDPGDRPEFKEQYEYLIRYQTRKADIVWYEVGGAWKAQFENGCERLKNLCDLIVLFSPCDFYSRNYLERMAMLWERNKRPDLLGLSESYAYDLRTNEFWVSDHGKTASFLTTCIASSAVGRIKIPEIYGFGLWRQPGVKQVAVKPAVIDAIKIFEGGGFAKRDKLEKDKNMVWLHSYTKTAFPFYEKLQRELETRQVGLI